MKFVEVSLKKHSVENASKHWPISYSVAFIKRVIKRTASRSKNKTAVKISRFVWGKLCVSCGSAY